VNTCDTDAPASSRSFDPTLVVTPSPDPASRRPALANASARSPSCREYERLVEKDRVIAEKRYGRITEEA
jgi:hypothetical protein